MTVFETFLVLMLFHFLADFPLQGDYLAKAKNPYSPLPGTPWYWAMGAHCWIHGGAVMLVTGSWMIGLAEFFVHGCIDLAKCKGNISYNEDQFLHVAFKVIWTLILLQ